MGTRSIINVIQDGRILVSMYHQSDGYPSGVGLELLKALNNGQATVINGFTPDHSTPRYFNGMGCLAAYLVSHFKKEVGNCYIHPPGQQEEYNYTVYLKEGELWLMVADTYVLHNGPLKDVTPDLLERLENTEDLDIGVTETYTTAKIPQLTQ